jgi:FMN-dependent oxidoreductase (nitrilotriacetate monooxygenase family)
MTPRKQMSLGLSMRYLGYHAAAWRHPQVDPGGASDYEHFLNVARLAEAAKFDMVFLADGIGIRAKDEPEGSLCRSAQTAELEPLTLLSALAPMTKHIGLVATASTTYNEPFHVARKYASLDRISRGRAGWNVVTSWSDAEARNFNRDQHLDYDTRYERAAEFVEVVKGLWDSWDEDAFVRDQASGIFFDASKMHVLNHQGQHFKVRGPLSVARSPQARPVLVQAGASEQGLEIAAASADVVYSAPHDIDTAKAYYASLKGRLAKYGRTPADLLVMPGFTPFVGRTEQEARDKYDQLNELVDPLLGLSYLYGQMGDLSGYPLDGPVPEPVDAKVKSIAKNLLTLARRDNLTIRQLYTQIAAGFGSRIVIGTPTQIADEMEAWVAAEAADGFNICPAALPVGLEDFATLVIPELQRRGAFRSDYAGATLRENLGLRLPKSRYAAA